MDNRSTISNSSQDIQHKAESLLRAKITELHQQFNLIFSESSPTAETSIKTLLNTIHSEVVTICLVNFNKYLSIDFLNHDFDILINRLNTHDELTFLKNNPLKKLAHAFICGYHHFFTQAFIKKLFNETSSSIPILVGDEKPTLPFSERMKPIIIQLKQKVKAAEDEWLNKPFYTLSILDLRIEDKAVDDIADKTTQLNKEIHEYNLRILTINKKFQLTNSTKTIDEIHIEERRLSKLLKNLNDSSTENKLLAQIEELKPAIQKINDNLLNRIKKSEKDYQTEHAKKVITLSAIDNAILENEFLQSNEFNTTNKCKQQFEQALIFKKERAENRIDAITESERKSKELSDKLLTLSKEFLFEKPNALTEVKKKTLGILSATRPILTTQEISHLSDRRLSGYEEESKSLSSKKHHIEYNLNLQKEKLFLEAREFAATEINKVINEKTAERAENFKLYLQYLQHLNFLKLINIESSHSLIAKIMDAKQELAKRKQALIENEFKEYEKMFSDIIILKEDSATQIEKKLQKLQTLRVIVNEKCFKWGADSRFDKLPESIVRFNKNIDHEIPQLCRRMITKQAEVKVLSPLPTTFNMPLFIGLFLFGFIGAISYALWYLYKKWDFNKQQRTPASSTKSIDLPAVKIDKIRESTSQWLRNESNLSPNLSASHTSLNQTQAITCFSKNNSDSAAARISTNGFLSSKSDKNNQINKAKPIHVATGISLAGSFVDCRRSCN